MTLDFILRIAVAALLGGAIGLDVPEAVHLCRELRNRGMDIPPDLYRTAELKDAILQLWSRRKEGPAC